MVNKLAQHLCGKILALTGNGKPLEIVEAFECFATDVISYYCFGQSHGFLDQKDGFEENLRRGILAGTNLYPFGKEWPQIFAFADWLVDQLPL
jgi:hypothetical protein